MDTFRTFAIEGLYFPAFAIAAGSLMVLVARDRRRPTPEMIASLHPRLRWLLRHPWERWGGWSMIVMGVGVAALKLSRGL